MIKNTSMGHLAAEYNGTIEKDLDPNDAFLSALATFRTAMAEAVRAKNADAQSHLHSLRREIGEAVRWL